MSWPFFHLWPGGDLSYLVWDRIDAAELVEAVSDNGYGGTVLFSGTVRSSAEDGPVVAIEYSAYEEMAESEFGRIVSEVDDRWPEARVRVQHRLGRVPVGDASVVIAAAAPHRAEAFEICRYTIDEVKKRVPIWKREFLAEGDARWRSNDAPTLDG